MSNNINEIFLHEIVIKPAKKIPIHTIIHLICNKSNRQIQTSLKQVYTAYKFTGARGICPEREKIMPEAFDFFSKTHRILQKVQA